MIRINKIAYTENWNTTKLFIIKSEELALSKIAGPSQDGSHIAEKRSKYDLFNNRF